MWSVCKTNKTLYRQISVKFSAVLALFSMSLLVPACVCRCYTPLIVFVSSYPFQILLSVHVFIPENTDSAKLEMFVFAIIK